MEFFLLMILAGLMQLSEYVKETNELRKEAIVEKENSMVQRPQKTVKLFSVHGEATVSVDDIEEVFMDDTGPLIRITVGSNHTLFPIIQNIKKGNKVFVDDFWTFRVFNCGLLDDGERGFLELMYERDYHRYINIDKL